MTEAERALLVAVAEALSTGQPYGENVVMHIVPLDTVQTIKGLLDALARETENPAEAR